MHRHGLRSPGPLKTPGTLGTALLLAALLVCTLVAGARAQDRGEGEDLALTAEQLEVVFPGAERLSAVSGRPPAAVAHGPEGPLGFVLSTRQVIGSVGYSGKPIDILVGLESSGRIAGALLRQHSEPILVIGVSEQSLRDFVTAFAGYQLASEGLAEPGGDWREPDAISGATVSSVVIHDSILRAARSVAQARGLIGSGDGGARLDRSGFEPAAWEELLADGSLVRLHLTEGEVGSTLGPATAAGGAPRDPAALFIDLYAGLATVPRVGENLLGKRDFTALSNRLGTDGQAFLVAANGLYSFKGTGWVRSGVFDRIQVVQGERTFRLTKDGHERVAKLHAEGAPEFREIATFLLPGDSGFDPLQPWRLELLAERRSPEGAVVQGLFTLPYELPARYRIEPPSAEPAEAAETAWLGGEGEGPLWQRFWYERRWEVALLGLLLAILSGLLVFQDALVRHGRLYRRVRIAFLAVTLVWLGWIVGGQLSVVNVLTFAHALLTGFEWSFFLLDPISFVLWSFVAVTLLFWGRGVFCGWLCPFGALQELLNEAARRLRVPQVELPFALHERLWPIKYVIFLGLFAVSLGSTNLAVLGAEVEPFKTAISLKFVRAWPFVVYALALLAVGLFIERFYCRYLCPLGAALAIPARLGMFRWLKRRHQCGRSCHNCAERCTVQAIHPDGEINPNECIYCLACQANYHDPGVCPPLAQSLRKHGVAVPEGDDERRGPRH